MHLTIIMVNPIISHAGGLVLLLLCEMILNDFRKSRGREES